MKDYIKLNHIEISAGDTLIVSTSKCPLTEQEADKEDVVLDVYEGRIPCCMCDAVGHKEIYCPYFESYIIGTKGEFVNCIRIKENEIN